MQVPKESKKQPKFCKIWREECKEATEKACSNRTVHRSLTKLLRWNGSCKKNKQTNKQTAHRRRGSLRRRSVKKWARSALPRPDAETGAVARARRGRERNRDRPPVSRWRASSHLYVRIGPTTTNPPKSQPDIFSVPRMTHQAIYPMVLFIITGLVARCIAAWIYRWLHQSTKLYYWVKSRVNRPISLDSSNSHINVVHVSCGGDFSYVWKLLSITLYKSIIP